MVLTLLLFSRCSTLFSFGIESLQFLIQKLLIFLLYVNNTQETEANSKANTDDCRQVLEIEPDQLHVGNLD
jgi:hypothetical protein